VKFQEILNSELSKAISIIKSIKSLSNVCGRTLSSIVKEGKHKGDEFYVTAIQFNRINCDAIGAIFNLLKMGYISESTVLLRWHLELGQLFFYLSQNKSDYNKWLSGKQIRPKIVRDFIEKEGFANWSDTYSEWSNLTHANSMYVENCFIISKMNPVNETQIILLSQLLRNLMFLSHKITFVIDPLLKPVMEVSEYNSIILEYNKLEELIMKFSNEHNIRENKILNQ